jgi:cell division septum initiation protein DivIVA
LRAETARRESDELLADARARAQHMVDSAREHAEQSRTSAQMQVDELMQQRDQITDQLDDLRGLLGLAPKVDARAVDVREDRHDDVEQPAQ